MRGMVSGLEGVFEEAGVRVEEDTVGGDGGVQLVAVAVLDVHVGCEIFQDVVDTGGWVSFGVLIVEWGGGCIYTSIATLTDSWCWLVLMIICEAMGGSRYWCLTLDGGALTCRMDSIKGRMSSDILQKSIISPG